MLSLPWPKTVHLIVQGTAKTMDTSFLECKEETDAPVAGKFLMEQRKFPTKNATLVVLAMTKKLVEAKATSPLSRARRESKTSDVCFNFKIFIYSTDVD